MKRRARGEKGPATDPRDGSTRRIENVLVSSSVASYHSIGSSMIICADTLQSGNTAYMAKDRSITNVTRKACMRNIPFNRPLPVRK